MATDFDPYRILEVDPSADREQIDEAYRRQWAAYPRDPGPDARLREIQAAYRILSDPTERRSYDERRQAAASAPVAVAEGAPLGPAPEKGAPWGLGDILRAIAVIVGVVIVASIPIFVAAIAIAGGSDNVDKSPNALAVELLASAVFQASALGAAWYFGLRKYHLNWAALGLRKPERGWPWLPFTLVLGALFIVFAYSIMLSIAGIKPNTDLPDAVYNHFLPLSIALVLTVFIAPVIEETFFRGFVFGGLMRRWGPAWAALGSGLLFGIAHLGNAGYFYVVPPIIGIGVLFAWSYRYSRSIFPSMAAHFLFNLIQMLGVLATR
ncbi:MAG: CPBP family glutamic-type intramembrane protease [Chloroflexota bacterium]|nr:CPBP family glutamic-type intramembrane protease [Chloroflexota bacterium]